MCNTAVKCAILYAATLWAPRAAPQSLGREVSIARHLQDGEEYPVSLPELVEHGRRLFVASWTSQEGGGRPLTKGTGNPLSDLTAPLLFPRNFNRLSAPDANSCAGCHNVPRAGGGGDIVANVFVLGQRFDFVTFDGTDLVPTRGHRDEAGRPVTMPTVANSRATLGMFGSGYIEMLARQMTAELQAIRDRIPPGGSSMLVSKGVSFGILSRRPDGFWDVSRAEGLPAKSLATTGPSDPPSLIIRPFHQAGAVVSLREFTNNAFNHHHGMQPAERFGIGTDPDNDGFRDELTRADITAATIFQATLPPPGRVIPNDPTIQQAVWAGEQLFSKIGCASCHIPALPLDVRGSLFSEPNPYNPPGNLQAGQAPSLTVDLNSRELPSPRLEGGPTGTMVPAYTDLKLHDICNGPEDPNAEPLDMQQPAGSPAFFAGNRKFVTRKLWGIANEPPFFHHGQFTTMREAILHHAGEAQASRMAFQALVKSDQAAIVEFLKTLQVLPAGAKDLIVDENGKSQKWPPKTGR